MVLYPRSDVAYVALPAESGGCGEAHGRPVVGGAPAKLWEFRCPRCELVLKDDPCWGASSLEIPLTPDEQRVAKRMEEEGDRVMHQVSAALAKSSIETMRAGQAGEIEATRLAQEKADIEARYQSAISELERLTKLVTQIQERSLDAPAMRPAQDARQPVVTAQSPAAYENTGTYPHSVSEPVSSGRCQRCGGPLKKPGTRGPAPKRLCLDCKNKKLS